MAAADGSVIIDITADPKQAVKGLDKVESKMNGFSSAAKKVAAVFASVFAVTKLVEFGKAAVDLGSDVAEVQNVVDTSFGDMAYKAEQFADSAIKNFGMSTLAAKKTASTYMAMAKNMGLSMDAASDMAITLAGLTGDVASFYNISQELADVKLKSVFTGETETLKDLGIVMTQTNLKAYAMSQGITKTIDSMSQSELVSLRYNFVLDQLSLASGDFVKTQDSWANQTRILSMQWQEFMSIIGQALTKILLPAVKLLNQVVSVLINAANAISAVISSLFGGENKQLQQTQQNVSGVSSGIGEAAENQENLTKETKKTAKAQEKTLSNFDEINKLSSGSGDGGDSGVGTAAGIIPAAGAGDLGGMSVEQIKTDETEAGISRVKDTLLELQSVLSPLGYSFEIAFADIKNGASGLLPTFQTVWSNLSSLGTPLKAWFSDDFMLFLDTFIVTAGETLGGLLDSFNMVFSDIWSIAIFPFLEKFSTDILPVLTQLGTELVDTFGVVFDEVKTTFDKIWQEGVAPALSEISKIWNDIWDSISLFWETWGQPIFDKVKEAVTGTFETVRNLWDTVLKPIWDKFMETVDVLWTEHLKPLWDNFLDFVGAFVDGALEIYNKFILPVVNWFIDTFGPIIADIINGVIERIGFAIGVIADFLSNIIDALKGVVDFVVGVFTGDMDRALNGLKNMFKGVVNGLITLVEGFINFFIKGLNWLLEKINTISFDVPDWVPGIGGSKLGFALPMLTEVKLPRLATGAVIPPNREFMAVLGDQKRGYNIEAPADLIRQIVREEVAASGVNRGAERIELVVRPESGFTRYMKFELDKESRRQGVSLVKVGG